MNETFIHLRTTKEKREAAKKKAYDRGMTITGMIRVALKKVFGIEI